MIPLDGFFVEASWLRKFVVHVIFGFDWDKNWFLIQGLLCKVCFLLLFEWLLLRRMFTSSFVNVVEKILKWVIYITWFQRKCVRPINFSDIVLTVFKFNSFQDHIFVGFTFIFIFYFILSFWIEGIGNLAKFCKLTVFKLTGAAFSLILLWKIWIRVLNLEHGNWACYYYIYWSSYFHGIG